MKSQDQITELFRKSAGQLTVEPSRQAWDRLESKLDCRADRVQIRRIRWISVAASIILVAGSFFLWQAKTGSGRLIRDFTPDIVEVLDGNGDCAPYCMLIRSRNELPSYYAAPVGEKWNMEEPAIN